jgi:membrane-associated phospholipid phosphatase
VHLYRFAHAAAVVVLSAAFGSGSASAGDPIQGAGTVLQITLPIAAAFLTAVNHDGAGFRQLVVSLAVSEGTTLALKYSINETRPNGGHLSFPSGHTSLSFASAEFVHRRYGWSYGAPAYVLATFVAYSRVEASEHYVHDVIAGAGIGILSSRLFTKPYGKWTARATGDARNFSVTLNRTW